jgi:hypothetical protein
MLLIASKASVQSTTLLSGPTVRGRWPSEPNQPCAALALSIRLVDMGRRAKLTSEVHP